MQPSAEPYSDGPFDESAFIKLSAAGQIDNLQSLLDAEQGYEISKDDCNRFRKRLLDAAAGPPSVDGASQNNDWRYRIARWMLRASDEFSISRETATIALAYCDRFLLTRKITRHRYQVAAITSLLVASKVFEKKPIKVAALMNYTQGRFDREEVFTMEKELVASIGSFMYPPTAGTFVLMLLKDFPCSASLSDVIETCQFMIELATCDFFFVAHKKSQLAVAAILVAFEHMHLKLSHDAVQSCLSNIRSITKYTDDKETMACVKQLRQIYSHNELRIKAIDSKCSDNVAMTEEANDRKRICRAATPSPTPEDQPELARFSEADGDIDGSQRKRQRTNVVAG